MILYIYYGIHGLMYSSMKLVFRDSKESESKIREKRKETEVMYTGLESRSTRTVQVVIILKVKPEVRATEKSNPGSYA